jgi:hypothetical protein
VFGYSDEEGTHAVELDGKVPIDIVANRYEEMVEWAAASCQEQARARLGSEVEVLVDGQALPPVDLFPDADPAGAWWRGRWYGQAPEIDGVVYFQADSAQAGDLVLTRLEKGVYPDYLATLLTSS